MDFDFFTSVIDRIDFDCTVVPWLNGEPLLHPRYFEMIKYITDRKIPCYITTNGTIWNDDLFGHLLDSNGTSCYQIIFSLDGLWDDKSRSIEKARPGTDRGLVRDNIETFLKYKRLHHSPIDTCVKICRRGQDYEEVEEYVIYWLQQKGVDFVCVGSALVDDKVDDMRIYPCQYSDNNFMVIKSDGRVAFCAYNDTMTNDPMYAVGMLDKTTPLLDFYNNEKYTAFRKAQRKGVFNEPCKSCGFAYTGHGIVGTVTFRRKDFTLGPVYYHQDYYNQFYSLKKKLKRDEYYDMEWDTGVCSRYE